MQKHEATLEYKDNRPEFKRRLAEDLDMPDGEITEAVTEAAAILLDRGSDEANPLKEKYNDLLCPWCGKLHFRTECQKRSEEYLATKSEGPQPSQSKASVPEGFNPIVIFYDAGSIGLRSALEELSIEDLKAVMAEFTALSQGYAVQKLGERTLVDLIIMDVKSRATRGQEFGDYMLLD